MADDTLDLRSECLPPSEEEVTDPSVVMTKRGPGEAPNRSRARGDRFVAAMAKCALAEFGRMKHTEVNRMMVRKFIRDKMREHDHRDAHIVRDIERCTELVFLPTEYDLDLKRWKSSRTAVRMYDEERKDYGRPGVIARIFGVKSRHVPYYGSQ